MKVWRDGKPKTIKIKTEAFRTDEELAQAPEPEDNPEPKMDKLLGAQMSELNKANRDRYRVAEEVKGVLITSVERRGVAAKNGLRPGDVIVQFGSDKNIQEPSQVTKVLEQAKKDKEESIAVLINRRGNPGFLVFDLK